MGDIHHYAWRATRANETVYLQPRDAARFGAWHPLQCDTDECVEVRRRRCRAALWPRALRWTRVRQGLQALQC